MVWQKGLTSSQVVRVVKTANKLLGPSELSRAEYNAALAETRARLYPQQDKEM